MDVETYPVCTRVSEGEEDEELLKNLEALDPCGEFDDDVFPQRVQNFLRQYEEKVSEAVAETDTTIEKNIELPENQEMVTKTCNPDFQLPDIQPGYSKTARKSTVRFRDFPKESGSPIIGRQPPRRSLLTTPGPLVGSDAKTTPFSAAEERGELEENNSPTRVGLKSKPRRLEQSESSEAVAMSSPLHSSSLIDFTIPYTDPPLPLTIQETPKERKPVSICTNVTNIIYKWTEPLTYRRDNYEHFLSEDCEPTNPIVKLLVATERLDLQDIRESQTRTGQVLITPHGQHKTYSAVIKKWHFDEVDWKDVTQGLRNLTWS